MKSARPRFSFAAALAAFLLPVSDRASSTDPAPQPSPQPASLGGLLRVLGGFSRPRSPRRGRGWFAGARGTPPRRSLRLRGRARGARRARKAANRGKAATR